MKALGFLAPFALVVACASHAGVERLKDGTLHVACKQPLGQCLEPAAQACVAHGYDIVHAVEQRETTGPPPWDAVFVKSEATLRCRQSVPAFGPDPNAPRPAASVAAAPEASAPRCVPGTSIACATPAGCTGAQVCAPNGASFGPCACASPSAPPAPAALATPASTAAAP